MLDLALLGPLSLARNGSTLELAGPKRRALLALLALHADSPLDRERIIDALWPEGRTGREESTLRVHVSHLRDVLEPDRAHPSAIVTHGSSYLLSTQQVRLDIACFEKRANEGRARLEREPRAALELLNEALGLWRGRALVDVEYHEFAQPEIRRLELLRTEALEVRAEALVALGEDNAAIDDLETLVRTHPTRESPVLLLMRALYRTGRQADALRVARQHTRQLAEQGLDASPRLGHLQERILQHDPALLPRGVTSPADIRPGRSVRGYELRAVAGEGSVGVVYRAFQASVGREVALKVIHPELAESPEFVQGFAREARLVASLEHPHIVPLHDFWREPTGAFLVMRWMDGGPMSGRLGRAWPTDEIARVFGQLADALAYAHSAGVVHRDVAPANVLFDAVGNAYLGDFGLAVTGIDNGTDRRRASLRAPYAAPELLRGEGPSVAADIFGLGALLAETATARDHRRPAPASPGDLADDLTGDLREVVLVATAERPADRFPDMAALRAALLDAVGTTTTPAPRRVRRNPYKGLAAFDESDHADFYGRDDVTETILGRLAEHGLTAVVGASGSGKSSVVMAGVVPQLRRGALPGSEDWAVVRMVPGTDPFDEFHVALRSAAVGAAAAAPGGDTELAASVTGALDGHARRALLIVDQFEELFSSVVEPELRDRFLDNLVTLACDAGRRVRVLATIRADFVDRALTHPRIGEFVSRSSVLVAAMQPRQLEDVIRRPAARVGVQTEPGLIAEIVRDVAASPAYLPLLQYVLAEMFERRDEDRLTVHAYRSLGGVQGVLERRAGAAYAGLGPTGQAAARQVLLRMVHLGQHGEETRRRLPLTELRGLGSRADVDRALEAFASVRLLTYDRDPSTRTPTVEVAHEAVLRDWTRYRIWIEEARADIVAHRRLALDAAAWEEAGEDPDYLLTGGPLAAATALDSGEGIELNDLERRYVAESRAAADVAAQRDAERRRRARALEVRSRRRLLLGVGAVSVALVVAVVAAFAWSQRQKANELASTQERQSLARELAAASSANLTSSDPDLSLLLAIEAAELSLAEEEPVLPEVVDALHRAVITPRPDRIIDGAGRAFGGSVIDYADDGAHLAMLTEGGGVAVIDPVDGRRRAELAGTEQDAVGVDVHADGDRVLVRTAGGVRVWNWRTGEVGLERAMPDGVETTAATWASGGTDFGVGGADGRIRVWRDGADTPSVLTGHEGPVVSIDFDPSGARLVSGGLDTTVRFWDVASGRETGRGRTPTIITPISHVMWHPSAPVVAVTTVQSENLLLDAETGQRQNSYGNGQVFAHAIAFDASGTFVAVPGADGVTRLHGTWTGGEAAITLPTGGVPLLDAAFDPSSLPTLATVGVDGRVRIWRDLLQSELEPRVVPLLYPTLAATTDGDRYLVNGNQPWLGLDALQPTVRVVDAATGRVLASRPTLARQGPRPAAISPDGARIALTGLSGDVELYTLRGARTVTVPGSATWAMTSLAFSHDGQLLAGGGLDGSIAIWEVASGRRIGLLQGHGDRRPANSSIPAGRAGPDADSLQATFLSLGATTALVDDVVFRPGARELASAGFDGTVRVWDLASGAGRVVSEFDHEALSVAYSPDTSMLAASDRVGVVRILDADTGRPVVEAQSVSGATNLTFSPDGARLAGAGPGAVAHLWDVATGQIVRRFHGAIYRPESVAFVNGGRELRVAGGGGIDRGYVLDPVELVDLARREASRDLRPAECRRYLDGPCIDVDQPAVASVPTASGPGSPPAPAMTSRSR